MLLTVLSLSVLVCRALALSNGDIRLVSTTSSNDDHGRLEIFLNSQWGTVCDDSFGSSDAQVVCQQLGYSSYSRYGRAIDLGYSDGNGEIWLDDLSCLSSYLHILQCSHNGIGVEDCVHSEDVAVVCSSSRLDDSPYTGQVRLVDGSYPSEGRVEVYCSGEWGTVCDDSFSGNDALTICRQLGYNDYDDYDISGFPSGSSGQPIWLDNLPCSSTDICVLDCQSCPSGHNCVHSEDVAMRCRYSTSSSISTATISTCNVYGDGGDAVGAIVGIIIGVIGGVLIFICFIGVGIYCCIHASKKQTPRRPFTQNVTSGTPSGQVPPSSYPQQPPASNPQFAYPTQYPAAYPVQTQAGYPAQVPYPAQVAYPGQAPYPVQGQAPYVYPNQPQGGVYPAQTSAQYPVATSEGGTAPPPPSNPELQQPPPPSYSEVQKESNPPYP